MVKKLLANWFVAEVYTENPDVEKENVQFMILKKKLKQIWINILKMKYKKLLEELL